MIAGINSCDAATPPGSGEWEAKGSMNKIFVIWHFSLHRTCKVHLLLVELK